ncbi:MAG TPA: hypothetical protein VMM38_07045 [Aridibacter sp.]|nr:hypothetical protein [Aridibacter sp.]
MIFIRAMVLGAEGEALEFKAEKMEQTAFQIDYTIRRSEKELLDGLTRHFLPEAQKRLQEVRDMQQKARLEAIEKLQQSTELLNSINNAAEWPEVLH